MSVFITSRPSRSPSGEKVKQPGDEGPNTPRSQQEMRTCHPEEGSLALLTWPRPQEGLGGGVALTRPGNSCGAPPSPALLLMIINFGFCYHDYGLCRVQREKERARGNK